MTITVVANDIHDARQKLAMSGLNWPIKIRFRRDRSYEWRDTMADLPGCIVDATEITGEEVQMCFKTEREALRYIAKLLKRHADYVREANKKRKAEEKKKEKKGKP